VLRIIYIDRANLCAGSLVVNTLADADAAATAYALTEHGADRVQKSYGDEGTSISYVVGTRIVATADMWDGDACTDCAGTGKVARGRYCATCGGTGVTYDYVRAHHAHIVRRASLDAQRDSLRTTHGKNGIPEMRAVDVGSDEAACAAEVK